MRYRKILIFIFVIVLVILYNVTRAKEKWKIIKEEQGLPHKFVKCITSDGNFIWLGTANGVALYDTSKDKIIKKLSTKDGLLDNFISAIAVEKDLVWIATFKGISVYNKKTSKVEKNWTKATGLSDNYITDIVITENYIWAATKFWGIDRMDKATKVWRNFSMLQGLADNSVNCIALDGLLLWAGTKNGLSYYDEFTGLWMSYDNTQGLSEPNVLSIAVDGNYIWCGTSGGGLARFDKYDESFRIFTTRDGVADDFIQSLKLDGSYLWIGTFSGVTKYDKVRNKWFTYTVQDGLAENSVSCMEIDGNYIWFGTDGGGVTRFDKEIPQAYISPLSFYKQPGQVVILGTAYDYKQIDSYRISFKNEGMKEWITTGIKLLQTKNIKDSQLAEWNVKTLPNFENTLRLEVINKDGQKNVATMPFIIDTRAPELTLQAIPEAVKESPIYVTGTFIENNITRILIMPDNITADVNRMARKYSAEIPLKKGINNIKITAYDIANQTFTLERRVIYDIEAPEIVLDKYPTEIGKNEIEFKGTVMDSSLQRMVLNPGNKEIKFEPTTLGEYKFAITVELESGVNKFQINAYDYVGNKTSVYPTVKYETTFPVVKIDKSVQKVNKPDFVLKGEWSDDNIDHILIEPPGNKAKIDFKNKTFSLKVKLKEGENVFTATIVDKNKNTTIDVMSVLYSTSKSAIELVEIPEYTSDKNPLIRGKYSEPNLKKIVLMPGGKEAMIDYQNEMFSIELPDLEYGENRFTIEMSDKFGNKTEKKFSLVFDNKMPELKIEDLPEVVNTPDVTIKGTYTEDYIDRIILKPGDSIFEINKKYRSFKKVHLLDTGENNLRIIAYDKAGNKTEIKKVVSLVPQVTTSVEEPIVDSEYVKKLKEEIARLKALLKQREGVPVQKKPVVHIPQGSAFYFVPYNPNENLTIMEISRKFIGNPIYIDFITRVNDINYINKRKKVLVPTKTLIQNYKKLHTQKYRDVIDIIGLSYNLDSANLSKFKKNLAYFLIKKGFIPKADIRLYQNKNIINLGDYVIAINISNYSSAYKNIIALSFSSSCLKVKIVSNRLTSNAGK